MASKHKLLLVLAVMLALGGAILATSPIVAYAASVPAVSPHASTSHSSLKMIPLDGNCYNPPGQHVTTCGGGCSQDAYMQVCISVNSQDYIVISARVIFYQACEVGIQLYLNWKIPGDESNGFFPYCYGTGWSQTFYAQDVHNDGHNAWYSQACYQLVFAENQPRFCVDSLYQYT